MTDQERIQETEDRRQEEKDLKYLQDAVRNATTNIQGCLKHIEEQIRFITEATNTYERNLNGN